MKLEKIKAIFEALDAELKVLEKLQPKDSQQRNIENETRKYTRKARKFFKGVNAKKDFKLESDGKGKPPVQERKLEPIDDSENVVLANNAETPKAKAKQKRARKSTKRKK